MAQFELKLPKMGESVAEATITSWLKEVGDTIEADEAVLEIATDKVDSEVPSEVSGILREKRWQVNDVVKVGETLAIIETKNGAVTGASQAAPEAIAQVEKTVAAAQQTVTSAESPAVPSFSESGRFYSPLVKNIAKEEGISLVELESIAGTGKDGRVTKNDILHYVEKRETRQPIIPVAPLSQNEIPKTTPPPKIAGADKTPPIVISGEDEIIEMDRMRKLISHHMTQSLHIAAHVQSFVEADVTNLVLWRERVKMEFEKREGEKLTFTPIFIEAVARALRDFPLLNSSIDGDKIIKKKHIHIGMATALPNGNLIVPVIKNADQLNLVGLTRRVNDLAQRARNQQLHPDDVQGGTYTITNVGNFGSIMGTPIINQPQVGILALGAIRKIPAVIETPQGDFIGIRHKMFLSHSYDHRIIDGALGGQFAKRVADYLEAWDMKRSI